MGQWRVYIKPFNDDGTYQDDFTEVTQDVTGAPSPIKTTLDDTDFDIGVLRSSSITIKLNNLSGKYSDVGETGSIFRFKRKDSQVKLTWQLTPDLLQCGNFNVGDDSSLLAEEKTVFVGLLNDDTLKQDVFSQFSTFKVLGREDLMNRVSVDIADVSNGDLISDALFAILNKTTITTLLNVSADNISIDSDQTIDDNSSLEGQTVFEAVMDFLRVSNSVLYIDSSDDIIITPRTAASAVSFNFFGQASDNGIENIQALNNVSSGVNRVFNFAQWTNTTIVRSDTTSINKFGVKKREISSDLFTDTTKREDMLDALVFEFDEAKQELDITARFDYDTCELQLLDRVDIDYPTVVTTTQPLPIVGQAIVGDPLTPLPGEQSAFTISTLVNYKITRKEIDVKKDTTKFHLREI